MQLGKEWSSYCFSAYGATSQKPLLESSSHVHARVSEYLCQLLRSEVLHIFYFSVVNDLIVLSECLSECQHVVGDHTSDLTIVHIDFNEKKSLYYYQQYNFETPSRLLYIWAVQSLVT